MSQFNLPVAAEWLHRRKRLDWRAEAFSIRRALPKLLRKCNTAQKGQHHWRILPCAESRFGVLCICTLITGHKGANPRPLKLTNVRSREMEQHTVVCAYGCRQPILFQSRKVVR
jgi:hypothetical protein